MWYFFTISKLFCFLSAEIAPKLAESTSAYRDRTRISPRTSNKNGSKLQKKCYLNKKIDFIFSIDHFRAL